MCESVAHPDGVQTVLLQSVHRLWRQQRDELRAAERTRDTHRTQNVSEPTHTHTQTIIVNIYTTGEEFWGEGEGG